MREPFKKSLKNDAFSAILQCDGQPTKNSPLLPTLCFFEKLRGTQRSNPLYYTTSAYKLLHVNYNFIHEYCILKLLRCFEQSLLDFWDYANLVNNGLVFYLFIPLSDQSRTLSRKALCPSIEWNRMCCGLRHIVYPLI